MARTNYQRGAEAEYRAKRELEAEGYYVMRSAASHDVWDLIAMNGIRGIKLIQVKSVKGGVYPSSFKREIEECEEFEDYPGFCDGHRCHVVKKEFWIWLRRIPKKRKAQWKKIVL